MVSTSDVVAVAIAALTVIVILAIGPFFGSTIDDTYTVTDTSADGWNRTANTDLVSPATTWITLVGLIVLMFLGVIIAKVLGALKNMKE